eukprot:s2717_g1.t1
MEQPRQLATPEETFNALQNQFKFSEAVTKKILELGCRTLSDFRFMVQDEAEDLKTMWFKRYHLKPDPSCMPSDRLISKLVRALRKKTLEVVDVWSVRSLTHQLTHSTKRRKVDHQLRVHTKYVLVPLDVLMRYKTRAEELAGRVGESQRLQLVSQLDGQERAEWSARYGASTDSLGQTIVTLMRERDALWISGSAGAECSLWCIYRLFGANYCDFDEGA